MPFFFRRIRLRRLQRDFTGNAIETSASNHFSLVVSIEVVASPIQRQASLNWPSSAWALAKYNKHNGNHIVEPVDRNAVAPEVIT
jgi:hypothetical protein